MELRQLRYVVAVAEELHFGRAAAREHITASALSQQVARLERELQVTLFERTPRHVLPTAAGAAFVAEARRVLAGAADAAVAARRAAAPVTLTVGFTSHGAGDATGPGDLVTDLLRRFRTRRPEVGVALRELDFVEHFSALPERVVDVQLVRLPYDPVPGVRVALLGTEPRLAVLPVGHPLLDVSPRLPLTAAELAGLPFFRLPPEVPADWSAHFAPWGSAPSAPQVATATEVLQLVAAGAGVALVPQSLGRRATRPDVVYVDADVAPSRLAVAWRPGDPADAVAALAQELADGVPV